MSASAVALRSKTTPPLASAPEVLGACVLYLCGLSYFFPVDETCPIVSRIGTVLGHLRVTIDPFITPPRANGTRDTNLFVPYEPPDVDALEDHISDFTDRTLEYRICLHELTDVHFRKHSKVSLRYTFFRDSPQQTEPIALAGAGTSSVPVAFASRHIVDVSDPLVKYLAGNNLMIEIFGWT